MKLAEALALRADAKTRLAELHQRVIRNAKVQEGDEPGESPSSLLAQLEQAADDLTRLIRQINRTNSATALATTGDGPTLSDALAERDVLALRQAAYRDLAAAATVAHDRYSKSEIRFRSVVNVAEIQKRADDLARDRRELDTKIQEANWRVDLIE